MSYPELFALLVGVNEYKNAKISNLNGCVNDVKAMYEFLTQRMGVPTENIRLLTSTGEESTEDRSSRKNIINGWMWLTERASVGDQVFFHYSGHGAQATSTDPNELDGYDETLVPFDSRENDANGNPIYDILDKELARLIAMVAAKGALVTVVLDCCHSGSGTRTLVPVRKTISDKRIRPPETLVLGTKRMQGEPAGATLRSGWKIDADHVLLAGCRDEELSYEYRSPVNGDWHGALTFFLLQKLQELRPHMTWQEVHDAVQVKVNGVYARQTPQLEGPGERTVFGGLAPSGGLHLNVTGAEDIGDSVRIRLKGGAGVGLTPGSRVELQDSHPLTSSALGSGEVIETNVDHAYALIRGVHAVDFTLPAKAKVTAYGYENLRYEVATEDPLLIATLTSEDSSPFLSVVDLDSLYAAVQRWPQAGARQRRTPQFHVSVDHDTYVIQDSSGVQLVQETPAHTAAGAAKTAENLHHLAVFYNVRNLRNPSPLFLLDAGLCVEAQTYTRAGFSAPKDGEPLGQDGVLPPGRKLWLTVRNNSAENLYVTVFNLSAQFGIRRIYPERAPCQLVAAGKEFFISNIETATAPDAEAPVEILKVFATRAPTSFDALEMPELNKPHETGKTRASGPLAELINSIRYDGSGPRKLMVGRDDIHDGWITKQVATTVLPKQGIHILPEDSCTIEVGSVLDISLEKPAGFSGQLVVSTLTNATWGIEKPLSLPPGLANPDAAEFFDPLCFSQSAQAVSVSPGVLALSAEVDQFSAVSAEAPLRLEMSVKDEPDLAGILPIAFDGEYYYVVGHRVDAKTESQDVRKRRMAVEITHLPIPGETAADDDVADERPGYLKQIVRLLIYIGRLFFNRILGEKRPAERDGPKVLSKVGDDRVDELPAYSLKRTLRLFFYRILHQKRPAELGVRKVLPGAAKGLPLYVDVTKGDIAKARKALLVTHGFGSNTEQLVQKALPDLLALDDYDLTLSYDYETINTGIRENGRLLANELRSLGFGADRRPSLDIFCHSMGTQVTRACVELEGGHEFVERVFMSGAHNTGTLLAEAQRLVPWLATILLNQAGLFLPVFLAQLLAARLPHMAAGMRDLAPSAEIYQHLNEKRTALDVKYYVQIGVNSVADGPVNWRKIFRKTELMRFFDKGLDQVLGPNDLLVGVKSAKSVQGGNWPNLEVDVLGCNHFEYFYTEESLNALRRQFLLKNSPVIKAPALFRVWKRVLQWFVDSNL